MGNKMTLADCVRLAEFAHFHQRDKAGDEYIRHPKRVLESVQAQGARPYVQMAAVLHDVTEDTPFTPQMLLDLGVPEAAVEIVKLVDRHESKRRWNELRHSQEQLAESWSGLESDHYSQVMEEWVVNTFGSVAALDDADLFYYFEIKKNTGAVQVKLADIGDNLQPWRLSYLSDETQERLRNKYANAIELLTDGMTYGL